MRRNCHFCGESFIPGRADQMYHSDACRKAAHDGRQREVRSSYQEFRSPRRRRDVAAEFAWWKYMSSTQPTENVAQILDPEEHRALSRGTNSAGGFLAPPDFADVVVERAVGLSAIAQLATQLNTVDGNSLPLPLVGTYGTASWIAEGVTGGAETDVVFAQGALGAFKSHTKAVASEELAEDSGIPFDALLARVLGKRLGVLQGTAYATGDGTGKPLGLATAAAGYTVVNAAAGSATFYVRADLKAVYKALPAAYRPRASWIMHPDDLAELQDRSVAAGDAPAFPSLHNDPPTLYGRPVYIDPFLPTPAANAHSLAFGDIESGYAVRRVQGIGVQRLVELFSDSGQIGYRAIERVDGRPLDLTAIVLLRHTT